MEKTIALISAINAFLKEFPFLKRYGVTIHRLNSCPKVQRVDLKLMDRFAYRDHFDEFYKAVIDSVRFIFIDSEGEEIGEARQSFFSKRKFNLFHESTWFKHNDRYKVQEHTVYEAIKELKDPNKIVYICEIEDSYNREKVDPSAAGLSVIIHKVPARILFSNWISKLQDQHESEIKRIVKKIDTISISKLQDQHESEIKRIVKKIDTV